jgi:hypothetical protein
VNGAEVGMRAWLETPAGKVYTAQHGGPARALAALYAADAAETAAARALQDEMERTRGRRPDLATAKQIVHRDPVGELTGSTADVVAAMNRYDPRWRISIDHEPRDVRVTDPVRA